VLVEADAAGPLGPYCRHYGFSKTSSARFLTRAFGFHVVDRTVGGAGGLHAELELGDGRIYLGQPLSGFRNPATVGRTSEVFVLVDDVDAHYRRAKDAGAKVIEELNDLPFGHRRYGCVDPQGREWFFAQPL
jgi:uncharacterized glyoxalase superfamily protein PhnB